MKVKNIKPILLKLPYLAVVYLFDKLCQAFRLSIRDNVLDTFLSFPISRRTRKNNSIPLIHTISTARVKPFA